MTGDPDGKTLSRARKGSANGKAVQSAAKATINDNKQANKSSNLKTKGASAARKDKAPADGDGTSPITQGGKQPGRPSRRNKQPATACDGEDELEPSMNPAEDIVNVMPEEDGETQASDDEEVLQDKQEDQDSEDPDDDISGSDSSDESDASGDDKEEEQAARSEGKKRAQPAMKRSKKRGRHGTIDELKELLKSFRGNEKQESKAKAKEKAKERKRGGIDSTDDLSPAFRKVIRQKSKAIGKKSYLPDGAFIEREAKRLAEAEFGKDHPASLIPVISTQLKSDMTKLVRGPAASSLKKIAQEAYSGINKSDYAAVLTTRSYRMKGQEQYGDDRFLKVARYFSKGNGTITLTPGQLAFAEYAVYLMLKQYRDFPKADQEALDAHNEFLKTAREGVNETSLVVKKTAK